MMITKLTSVMLITCVLVGSYPQKLLINSGKLNEIDLQVVEKWVNHEIKFLKENIKIPQLCCGYNENKIKIINDRIESDICPKIEDAEKTVKEYFMPSDIGDEEISYEINSDYFVTKNDNKIISIYNNYYEFLGGAHGNTIRTSYTIDRKEEKLLNLKDLFVDEYDYKSIIDREIYNKIKEDKDNYFDQGNVFKGINDNSSYYIEGNDLIIYYQLYEIAPYVFGIPEFKISLNLFGDNYKYNA